MLASMNSGSVSFQYDPYGRRVAKTVVGITTNYLYDRANIAQELSGGSPIANLLTGGIDRVFTRTDSTGTANFLTDALGSTINLTNSSGGSVAQYAYEPFGKATTTSGSSTNEFQYTGRENDGTGLYFYRARYFNPSLQRFISEDPVGCGGLNLPPLKSIEQNSQYLNLYAYVNNMVMNLTDPFGLCPDCSYYETRCHEVLSSFSKSYYCGLVPFVCNHAGCSDGANCMRRCLIDADKECVKMFGRYGDAAGVCHEFAGHAACVSECFGNGVIL